MSLPGERLNVGPGQYTPGYVYGREKAPSFSMRSKHDGIAAPSKPGPGAYEYRSHMSVREKGHDFGKEMRSKYDDHRVPGPGSYDYDNAVFKLGSKMEPSYGMGSRLMVNTDGYDNNDSAKCLVLAPMSPRKKCTPTLAGLSART